MKRKNETILKEIEQYKKELEELPDSMEYSQLRLRTGIYRKLSKLYNELSNMLSSVIFKEGDWVRIVSNNQYCDKYGIIQSTMPSYQHYYRVNIPNRLGMAQTFIKNKDMVHCIPPDDILELYLTWQIER